MYNKFYRKPTPANILMVPILAMLLITGIAMLLQEFIGGRIARKLAISIVNPQKGNPIGTILTVQICTV
ncbi:MAG: hypothetical protein PHG19_03550 [Anaerotignum sp.]|nr:hypothetical protein [Anaerotignum sp.]